MLKMAQRQYPFFPVLIEKNYFCDIKMSMKPIF